MGGGKRLEERAQQLETKGWGKMKEAVAGSEAEGLYGLLRGVTLHSHPLPSQPPLKKPCFAPGATISQPSPQESTGPEVSDPAGQATGPASPAAPISSRGGHSSPHATPLNSTHHSTFMFTVNIIVHPFLFIVNIIVHPFCSL